MNNTKNNKKSEKKISSFLIFLNKYKKFIMGFLCLIILIPGILFLIKPEYQKTKNLSAQQLPLKERKLAELEVYYQDLDNLAKNLEYLLQYREEEFERLKKILPKEADIAGLFAQMEALFADKEFEILNISFTETPILNIAETKVEDQKIGMIDISLDVSGGGYADFKELLDNIERHLRILDITSINFGDIYLEDEEEIASYVMTLRAYYLF